MKQTTREVLEMARYRLVTLSGLYAYDVPPGPSESFQIDERKAIGIIDAVLETDPVEGAECSATST